MGWTYSNVEIELSGFNQSDVIEEIENACPDYECDENTVVAKLITTAGMVSSENPREIIDALRNKTVIKGVVYIHYANSDTTKIYAF